MYPERILAISNKLAKFTEAVGKWGSIFILPLVIVTMWDVVVRKIKIGDFSLQIWLIENGGFWFESTKIQELEWHFHTALFALVLGYGYINNRHVRVDLVRENLSFRKQAWIEFLGCTLFFIPFCAVVTYFATQYAWDAFLTGEISASTVGLSHRWIIKTVFLIGIIVAGISGAAVWLQTVLVLFGPRDLRFELMTLEWPEEQARKAKVRKDIQDALDKEKKK